MVPSLAHSPHAASCLCFVVSPETYWLFAGQPPLSNSCSFLGASLLFFSEATSSNTRAWSQFTGTPSPRVYRPASSTAAFIFPACTADHNCCGVAETFLTRCAVSAEERASQAAWADTPAAWLPLNGCGWLIADGDFALACCGVANAGVRVAELTK